MTTGQEAGSRQCSIGMESRDNACVTRRFHFHSIALSSSLRSSLRLRTVDSLQAFEHVCAGICLTHESMRADIQATVSDRGPSAADLFAGQACQGSWVFLERGDDCHRCFFWNIRSYALPAKVRAMGHGGFN